MNTDELHRRMIRSTAWTEHVAVDPAPDLSRGRGRLRRRRLGAAGTSLLAATVVAAGVVGQPGPTAAPTAPAIAAAPTTGPQMKTSATTASSQVNTLTERYLAALARHADPGRAHLYNDLSRQALLSSTHRGRLTGVTAEAQWRQGGGLGYAAVEVVAPGYFDNRDSQYRSTECLPSFATEGSAPAVAVRYNSCHRMKTMTGLWVRVGTVDGKTPKGYFASYVRPDGHLVIARIDGTLAGRNPIVGTPDGPPVQAPAVTTAMLAAVVTDPALTLS